MSEPRDVHLLAPLRTGFLFGLGLLCAVAVPGVLLVIVDALLRPAL